MAKKYNNFRVGGSPRVENEDYSVWTNDLLERIIASKTVIQPGRSTVGHKLIDSDVVYVITNGRGTMEVIEYANSLEAKVHFNIVWNPEHESLRFLPAPALKQILDDVQRQRDRLPATNSLSEHNANQLSQVIHTIEQWIGFQREDYSQANFSETVITSSHLVDSIFTIYRDLYQKVITHSEAQKALHTLRMPEQNEPFLSAYFEALVLCSQSIYPDRDHAELTKKISGVMQLMHNQQGVGEMIHEMIEGGLLSQIDFLWGTSDQQLEDTLRAKFYFDVTSVSIAS